jgi:predicted PurR-regulated permease PerM
MDFKKLRFFIFVFVLAFVTYHFWHVIKPFAYPIFWAGVIAALWHPFCERINKKIKNTSVSVTLTIILVTVIILIPLSILGTLLVSQSINLYSTILDNRGQISESLSHTLNSITQNPHLARLHLNQEIFTTRIAEIGQAFATFVFNTIKNVTQNSVEFLIMFIIMLYTLFFFLRDGKKILKNIFHLSPLGDKYENMLYTQFTSTVRATLKGTFILGLIQGFLGGVVFWITGIPAPLIWGIIMSILSILPGVGSVIVWLPAAVAMLLLGNFWQAVVIVIAGLFIGTIDNVLRPFLVGKDTEMPQIIVFFSTLGGVVVFGASGFLIGPIIASLFLTLWTIYEHYYRTELNNNK